MTLKKSSGNMYSFIDTTWNGISGKCPHDCSYCYVTAFYNEMNPQRPMHLNEKALREDLGKGNFIFVGSGFDMFAKEVPDVWINLVLNHCKKFDNTYLFQSKDPYRFLSFSYPEKVVLGTTIETNRSTAAVSKAPSVQTRASAMSALRMKGYRTMVTAEPIMDFDLEEFVALLKEASPEWINIGADSKHNNLPEPSAEKIGMLIMELEKFTKVKLKDNLKRIYPQVKQ